MDNSHNDSEKLKRIAVPYGFYFGILQLPVAWLFRRWFSMSVACGFALMLLTLLAYPIFMRGMPIYFLKWRTGSYWTFVKWLPWTVVMGLVGFVIGYIVSPFW